MQHESPHSQHDRPLWLFGGLLFLALGLCGCARESAGFDDEAWARRMSGELVEVPIGKYRVTLSMPYQDREIPVFEAGMCLEFTLDALVLPDDQPLFEKLLEERHDEFNDELIRVCRNASWEDLSDPNVSLIKGSLRAVSDEIFKPNLVKKFVISDLSTQQH